MNMCDIKFTFMLIASCLSASGCISGTSFRLENISIVDASDTYRIEGDKRRLAIFSEDIFLGYAPWPTSYKPDQEHRISVEILPASNINKNRIERDFIVLAWKLYKQGELACEIHQGYIIENKKAALCGESIVYLPEYKDRFDYKINLDDSRYGCILFNAKGTLRGIGTVAELVYFITLIPRGELEIEKRVYSEHFKDRATIVSFWGTVIEDSRGNIKFVYQYSD